MVKQGDRVIVGGIESVVTSSWGQGKHKAYALEDGRTVLDIKDDAVVKKSESKRLFHQDSSRFAKHERMPKEADDIEE